MHEVGEILFLVAIKTAKVVPVRVTAVTITKTLEGETVSHKLEFADAPGQEAKLEDLGVEVFTKISDLQDFMISKATNVIRQQVKEAQRKVVAWSENSDGVNKIPPEFLNDEILSQASGTVTVVLDDGVKANVILPPELG